MKIITPVLAITMLLSGCTHRILIGSVSGISMTQSHLPKGKQLASRGPVESRYCADKYKVTSGRSIGLIDEAVRSAQKEKNADFIRDVRIFQEVNCVIVEGEAYSIK